MVYQSVQVIIEMNSNNSMEDIKEEELTRGLLLKKIASGEVGILVNTGEIDTKSEHKSTSPRGSPYKYKQ